ncbi:acyltransferase family protein [Mediterraneibacter glycyrrhizinilyticus]|uniref:acyltransferase family protein n=1 Tax=Mediterraneibacter glycyrrhizinilyticus TaxID=342942 RepID=UPI0025AA7B42|nr:acyltransferase family protein [Mediterraneibacter glycyrrhizinilyticus]MDN0043140.1 acyltransferase family protein [Mediterraneibacter glycyrrhizinilyticus]
MDLFAVLPAILLLWNCGYSDFNQVYLSKDNSRTIKGFCSILIVIHHIAQRTTGGIIFPAFGYIGFLVVGVFFFYSGYGVMVQYELKGRRYLESFFGRRVWKVVRPYLVANAVYLLLEYILGRRIEWNVILQNVVSGKIVPFSWFVISIIVLYCIFWLSCILTRRKGEIALIIVGITVYCFICMKMGLPDQWYVSAYSFVLGCTYCHIKEKAEKYFSTGYWVKLLLMLALALIFVIMGKIIPQEMFQMIFCNVGVMSFCMFTIGVTMRFTFHNRILTFLGENNYEIYLYQGIFVSYIVIGNNLVYAASTVCLLLAVVYIMRMINVHIFPGNEKGKRQV